MTKSLTIIKHESATLIEKKSRFIADIFPVQTESAAQSAIEKVRQMQREASHLVFAYRLGLASDTERFSDNGEPSGTAGKPVLDAISKNHLVNVLVTVTRYFGGIKLGAGGLIRAYSSAAAQVIEQSQIFQLIIQNKFAMTVDYPDLDRLQYFIQQQDIKVLKSDYGEKIRMILLVPQSKSDPFQTNLANLFSARIGIKKIGETLSPAEIKD